MPWETLKIRAPRLEGAWLNVNGEPSWAAMVAGGVVLVDFWEFTCVNCLRTLPYLAAWHERYAALGLTVVGTHTPEWSFGRRAEVVEAAVARLGIPYPVLLDPDAAHWRAFANRAWPTKYLIDGAGIIRYRAAGEGRYAETEAAIQTLLRERHGDDLALPPLLDPLRATDAPGAVCYRTTPEIHLGGGAPDLAPDLTGFRNLSGLPGRARLAEGGPPELTGLGRSSQAGGHDTDLSGLPGGARLAEGGPPELTGLGRSSQAGGHDTDLSGLAEADGVRFEGPWRMAGEFAESGGEGARLHLRFQAAEVNAVLATADGHARRVWVTLDGQPLAMDEAGEDVVVDSELGSYLSAKEPRLYNLVILPDFTTHDLTLEAPWPGLQLFAFSFASCTKPEWEEGDWVMV